jgi:hypothetical protein
MSAGFLAGRKADSLPGVGRLVNWYAATIGHDACKSSSVRWVEPLVPGNLAASIHPNLRGMQGAANVLVSAVRG